MTELKGKNILVIGASGVLGSLITQDLSKAGATVMASSSSISSADKIPSVGNPRLLVDLSSNESIDVLVEYLLDSGVPIDGIVIASGIVAFGNFADLGKETLEKLFAVNALGPIRLVRGLIPALKISASAGKDPFVVTISGVVAESPMAGLAAYSASKSALNAFFTAASRELKRDGIRVLDARPGHTETGLAGRAIEGVPPTFPQGMDPSSVAKRIISALLENERDLPSAGFQ